MSTIILDGVDHRTSRETVTNFCQSFGRILNSYIKSNQCIVTFAQHEAADELIRSSPHRLDAFSHVNGKWKTTTIGNPTAVSTSTSNTRLIVRGTSEQLIEKILLDYFSQFGSIRMCHIVANEDYALITFDHSQSCEHVFKQSRHFLCARSLIVEPYSSNAVTKRRKTSVDPPPCPQPQQWQETLLQRHNEHQQQILHYQLLLQQTLEQVRNKDRQIEQLTQENKDLDQLLRQSIHDNEQQQIQHRKREEIHQQAKRKYEELYKCYMKLKEDSAQPVRNSTTLTVDDVRKKL